MRKGGAAPPLRNPLLSPGPTGCEAAPGLGRGRSRRGSGVGESPKRAGTLYPAFGAGPSLLLMARRPGEGAPCWHLKGSPPGTQVEIPRGSLLGGAQKRGVYPLTRWQPQPVTPASREQSGEAGGEGEWVSCTALGPPPGATFSHFPLGLSLQGRSEHKLLPDRAALSQSLPSPARPAQAQLRPSLSQPCPLVENLGAASPTPTNQCWDPPC